MDFDSHEADRYGLSGYMERLAVLQDLLHSRLPISVTYREGRESLLTTLLSVGRDGIVFDLGVDRRGSERLLSSRLLGFSCRPEGVLVRFECESPVSVEWDGGVACRVPLPDRVVRLQRREYFRVCLPVAKPVPVFVSISEGMTARFTLHDLSVGGAGLSLVEETGRGAVGTIWEKIKIKMENDETVVVDCVVRHLTPISHGKGRPLTRIGLQFKNLSRRDEAAFQRWIVHIEKERRRLEQREP